MEEKRTVPTDTFTTRVTTRAARSLFSTRFVCAEQRSWSYRDVIEVFHGWYVYRGGVCPFATPGPVPSLNPSIPCHSTKHQ